MLRELVLEGEKEVMDPSIDELSRQFTNSGNVKFKPT